VALITKSYRALCAELHRTSPDFGTGGAKASGLMADLTKKYHTTDVLDYGCGKGKLNQAFPFVKNYDPCVEEFSALPSPADIVICRDVMEHVEYECIDEVLDHLSVLARKAVYFNIGTRPAGKNLPDGRNTHISLHPVDWWRDKLERRWKSVNLLSYVGLKNVEFLCE
jgi:hypothetical protein